MYPMRDAPYSNPHGAELHPYQYLPLYLRSLSAKTREKCARNKNKTTQRS